MARGATATAEAPAEPQSIFDTIEVETKAGTFSFREMDGETYDRCVELATRKTDDGREVTDMVALLRWLAAKSSVDNLDIEGLNKLPFHARQKVLTEVNRLYFPDELEDLARQLRMAGWEVTPPKREGESGNS